MRNDSNVIAPDISHDVKMEQKILNRNIGDTNNSIRSNRVMLENDKENKELELSDITITLQKRYSEIATTSLVPNYWEMQRTDSDQSIIKVTTASTPFQSTERNKLYHFNTAQNGNDDLNSEHNQIEEFTTLKENPSLLSTTYQSPISANDFLTNDMPYSDDDLIATTATNINDANLLSTTLTFEQNRKTQSVITNSGSTEDITDFDIVETVSAKSSNFMGTTDVVDLMSKIDETEFSTVNPPSSPSEIDFSSFSTLHLKTSPAALLSTTATTDAMASIDDDDDDDDDDSTEFPFIDKSEITNSRNFDRKETNLDSIESRNVELDELEGKKITINSMHNLDEQRQSENEQMSLSDNNPSELLKFH
ncbi:unnamed protein product [Onchocerca flexuosa]|uniref:Uncharacterized protein n=1 Tax=Onchocerca flexuosa TaxID=387005 RepID=A0A183HN74_9BILA|nr:unnamed protein product [Onchocerca flexuosa]